MDVLPSLQAVDIGTALHRVVNIYARGGFQVTTAMMDGAFAGLQDVCNQLQVTLNTTSRDEHVGDVERYIQTIKERMRGVSNTIPFKRLTRNMVMELAKAVVYWLNSVPSNMGVSPTMSPRTIITGQLLDYHKHCQYEFGEYVQTHEEHDNSLLSHTVGAIALRPTGNQQGGYFFMWSHYQSSTCNQTADACRSDHQSRSIGKSTKHDTIIGIWKPRQPIDYARYYR